ncbi:MAG: helix-turn-helix domain-containing protein [Candidatus Acidiferrales bacterium]
MDVGDRFRALRKLKKLSQSEIERRTGLLRCYISRVENGHSVPTIDTLEKMARAIEVPLYQLFYDGEKAPKAPIRPKSRTRDNTAWGSSGKDARVLHRFHKLLNNTNEKDRRLLLFIAQKLASSVGRPSRP